MEGSHRAITKGLPSGSGFDSEFRCLGKREAEKKFPERDDTTDSRRGDRIHKALETTDFETLSGGERLTAEICMDTEGLLVDKYGFHGAGEVIWEKRYWDVDDDLNPLWSVQVDYARIETPRALVIDHKTGWGIPVPIDQNWQMKAQAGLIWFHHGVDQVVAALSHPHHPDSRYEVRTWSAKECAYFMTTIRGNVALIQQPGNPRTPNGTSCQFCRAKHICIERQELLDNVARDIVNEIRERGFTALIDRTPEGRAEHFRWLKQLADNCERMIQQYVTMVAKDPDAVKGFKLQKAWQRTIKDEVAALERVEKEFGHQVASDSMVFNLVELVEAIRRKEHIGKEKAEAKAVACLDDAIKWTPKRPWLVEQRYYGEADDTRESEAT